MNLRRAASAVVLTLLLAACGSDDPTPVSAPPSTTTTTTPVAASVDWAARSLTLATAEGYAIGFCEGEAPMLCVTRDGADVGVVELASFPVSSIDVLADGDLSAWAEDFARAIARDRAAACGDGYAVAADEPVPARLGGAEGIFYRLTGTLDGRTVERVAGVAAVVDGQLWLLTANALDEGGCLSREQELGIDDLDRLTGTLRALAAGSALPHLGATETGWLRGRDATTITIDPAVLLDGAEAEAAAREDGRELDVDFYVDDDEPTTTEYRFADDALVELYDCTGGCVLRPVPRDEFVTGRTQPYGGSQALVSLVVRDGEVVRLTELYLP